MKKIFLSDLDSWNKILEEEASLWVKEIIKQAGLDCDIVFSENKGRAVEYLIQNRTSIEFDMKTSSIKIFKNDELIGSWIDPTVTTKIDDDGNPFAEISVDVSSVKEKQSSAAGKNKK